MRLRDKVELAEGTMVGRDHSGNPIYEWSVIATLRAEVIAQRSELLDATGWAATELHAIVEPFTFDPVTHRLRWRGDDYENNGDAMTRAPAGRVHHLTIPIRRIT